MPFFWTFFYFTRYTSLGLWIWSHEDWQQQQNKSKSQNRIFFIVTVFIENFLCCSVIPETILMRAKNWYKGDKCRWGNSWGVKSPCILSYPRKHLSVHISWLSDIIFFHSKCAEFPFKLSWWDCFSALPSESKHISEGHCQNRQTFFYSFKFKIVKIAVWKSHPKNRGYIRF